MSIYAKKSLGQNFLASEGALRKIVDAAKIRKDEIVLEIGPGKGVLTKELLGLGARVVAIEKDRRLIAPLQVTFENDIREKRFFLIEGDALDTPTPLSLIPKEESYKIVANIPYYITGNFLRSYLTLDQQPSTVVILVQKEVAERIVAKDKKESLLSISVKAYGEPKIVAKVPRGSFVPAPKVDSAILAIEKISKENFKSVSEEKFFSLLRKGFAHKRKLLSTNLGIKSDTLRQIGLNPSARAENLAIGDWRKIVESL